LSIAEDPAVILGIGVGTVLIIQKKDMTEVQKNRLMENCVTSAKVKPKTIIVNDFIFFTLGTVFCK
jgi:hypothetical protein